LVVFVPLDIEVLESDLFPRASLVVMVSNEAEGKSVELRLLSAFWTGKGLLGKKVPNVQKDGNQEAPKVFSLTGNPRSQSVA
jgi:hypothetical protein